MLKSNDVRELFKTTKPNVYGMVEIHGISFEADEPSIFGEVNEEYVVREIAWYNSQSLNVNDLGGKVPKIWKHISTDEGYINSNYGWCIFSRENGYQFDNVVRELSFNPESRRGCMIYNRPSMHQDAHRDSMNDFMCTNAVNYYIDDKTLIGVVQMRSNDIVYGYKNDWAWQKYVIDKLSDKLGTHNVKLIWQVGSIHMYPQHVEKFLCQK